jgi:hypothetical protein
MIRRRLRAALETMALRVMCVGLGVLGRLRARRVIVYYKFPDFARKAEAIADLLRTRGFRAEVRSGMSLSTLARLKSNSDLWIGFWNELPVSLLPKHYVFYNAEPLNVSKWRDNPEWSAAMRNSLGVWGYSKSNAAPVAQLGARFHHVPFGYAPYYEKIFRAHTQGKTLAQDIDVLFFGNLSERRRQALEQVQRLGVNVRIVSHVNPAYGEELDELLARSKIILGIHDFAEPQAQIADLARLDHLLSNGLFVVHERPSNPAADPSFERNVTTCEFAEIGATCAYFLKNPDERARRAEAGHRWFKAEHSLDAYIPYDEIRRHLRELT